MSFFAEVAPFARPLWLTEGSTLRRGQLGAIWALASHFTVSSSAVQAVLPTGMGKTAVMNMVPLVVPTTRVLVVAPSRLVRDQVAEQFRTLAVLRTTGALVGRTPLPQVRRVEHRIDSDASWRDLARFDVVVGTPQVLSDAYAGVAPVPTGLFDLLLVDEAHHAAAPTWRAILEHMRGVRTALFTATPFRRDGAGIPADIAYAYSLSQAIQDGVYQPIDFIPVELMPGMDRDIALATAAAARLNDSVHTAARSGILVRTDRIDEAERLVDVYRDVGVEIGVVHSRQALRTVRSTLRQLEDGELRGIASVGVLGEGFDLPRLKVAVYHRRHRSLPATLQFVGRIARVAPGVTPPPAELLAVREDVQDETRELYADDATWGELMPAMAEAAVEHERARRTYVQGFDEPPKGEFSLFAVQPKLQAELFDIPETTRVDLARDLELLAGATVTHTSRDRDNNLLLVVTRRRVHPEWLKTTVLDVKTHDLHIVYNDVRHRLLFVSTTSRATCEALLEFVRVQNAVRLSAAAMSRILHGVNITAYSSIGLRSARAASSRSASYRTLAGSAVQQALLPGETRAYGVGHLIGRNQSAGGHFSAMGVSVSRAKIWSVERSDLLGFKQWCEQIGDLARSSLSTGQTAPLLDISLPTRLERYPQLPVAAILDPAILQGDVSVQLTDGSIKSLVVFEVVPTRLDDTRCRLEFRIDDAAVWACIVDVRGNVSSEVAPPTAWRDYDPVDLRELLEEYCPTIYFADGSSAVVGVLHVPPERVPPAPAEMLMTWDWTGVDIQAEAKVPRSGLITVQAQALGRLRETLRTPILILDDGAGELADLVAIEVNGQLVTVHLVHCKWSKTDAPGKRLDDVHEVLCQVMRSARWTGVITFWAELARRLRVRPATRIVGDEDEAGVRAQINAWAVSPPQTAFRIMAVQPGLVMERISDHAAINCLLVSCHDWVADQGAKLVFVGA